MISQSAGRPDPLDISAIKQARDRIAPYVVRTRLEKSDTLSQRLGTGVYVKYELFQKTGSFKVRGAFNKILGLTDAERSGGVVAVSGGNHAQAVAYAARQLGIRPLIVMPESTPRNYVAATEAYGAEVDLQPTIADAFARIGHYRAEGMAFIHPFDDPQVMAGQGTLGLEIVEDLPDATDVIVSIGGGGLMSGVAAAVKGFNAQVRIWGVETEGADAMSRALAAGCPVRLDAVTSIAKTLGAPEVSEATLDYARAYLECVTLVPDSEAVEAMIFILERLKVMTEPAASCTLAAADRLRDEFGPESNVVLIMCGGNTGVRDLCGYLPRVG